MTLMWTEFFPYSFPLRIMALQDTLDWTKKYHIDERQLTR